MAPFRGPGRAELLRLLRSWFFRRKLPVTLSKDGSPAGTVGHEDGVFRLRLLEMDEAAMQAEYARRQAAGDTYWMPEMTWRFLRPGRVLAEARSRKDFQAAVERLAWPFD